ncbi:MAG: HIT domain-containing protein [Opitutales bacterium]|nr:HIT domain-containing protein [Opitutales bacterium]
MSDKTIFEKIIDRTVPAEILLENEYAIVIKDINPQAPIHVLIIPKHRILRISEVKESESSIISNLFLTAAQFAKENNISDFRLVINNGAQAGETVPHLHIHLLSGRPMGWPPG